MGTLDDVRHDLRVVRSASSGARRTRWRRGAHHLAAIAIQRAVAYRDDLGRRQRRSEYVDEINDLQEVIHALAIAEPGADPEAVWRGWTRDAGGERFRVDVVRAGQHVVGRRGRARVEDAFVVRIDGSTATPPIRRDAAMKQARWATMVVAGVLPTRERIRLEGGRRWRLMAHVVRRTNRERRAGRGHRYRGARAVITFQGQPFPTLTADSFRYPR